MLGNAPDSGDAGMNNKKFVPYGNLITGKFNKQSKTYSEVITVYMN